MKKSIKNIVLSTAVAGLLLGCSGDGDSSSSSSSSAQSGSNGSSGSTSPGGGGQKGPFKAGQTVTATLLNADGTESDTLTTTTTDELGKFKFTSLSWNGPTEFKVEGEYLNESDGKYVAGGLLTAITDVVEGSAPTVNINILTHISAKNIKEQMLKNSDSDPSNDVSIAEATQSAKQVIQETFNLKLDDNTDFEDLDLTDGSAGINQVANTQLLKISAALASTDDPEKTLDNLAEDLKDGGIDDEAEVVFQELKTQEENVDLAKVAANLESVIDIKNVPSSDDLLAGTISLDNTIKFTDVLEAFKETIYPSNEIVVKGIYGTSAASISIENGEFSIDGAAWSSTASNISNGQTLKIRVTSSDSYDSKTTSILNIGGTKFTYNVTTKSDPFVADTKVKAFNFDSVIGQNVSTQVTSAAVTIDGINTATDIFISDGSQYTLDGGTTWTSAAGTINNGNTLQVRHTSSSSFSDRIKTTVTFGLGDNQVQSEFKSYTIAQDKTPTEFPSETIYDSILNSTVEFASVTVKEITGNVKISVINGEYKIGTNGSWTNEDGTVFLDDEVFVRHTASTSNNTKTSSSLIIGTKSAEFNSYTVAIAEDKTPNEFNFAPQTNVATDTKVTDTLTISGINTATPISVINGEYRLNSGTWTSAIGTVSNNDTVEIRHTSSSNNLEKTVSTLNIGGIESKLVSFTKAADDTTPNTFVFALKNTAELSTLQESENITIKGINAASDISVTNGEYSLDNGTTWTSSPGTVEDSNTVKVRHTSSASTETKTETILTVGTISSKFISVTKKPNAEITSGTPASSVNNGAEYIYQATANNVSSWKIENKPKWATFNTLTGKLSGTPNNKFYEVTPSSITITALNDAGVETSMTPFTITVNNANPTLVADSSNPSTVTKGNSLLLKVNAKDTIGESLTYSLDSAPNFIEIDSQTGVITNSRTIVDADVGPHTINVKVADGSSASSTVSLDLEVTQFVQQATAPSILGTPRISVAQGSLYNFTPIANDVNGDSLTFSITNKPAWLELNTNTGTLSGTPSNSDVGTYNNIIISVNDGNNGSDSLAPFNIEVTNVNDKPIGTTIPNTEVVQGKTLNYDIKSYFSDVDGDSLTYYASQADGTPLPFGVTFVNGVLIGTPGQEAVGENLSIKVFAVDKNGEKSDPITFSVSVINVNDAPTLGKAIENKLVKEDELFTYDIKSNFEDLDADELSYIAKMIVDGQEVDLPSEITFAEGIFTGTLGNDKVGRYSIKVTASDAQESVSDIFEIIVQNVNDVPILETTIEKQKVNEDTLFNYDVKPHFKDIDVGDVLTFTATLENGDALPENLKFDNGVFTGTPDNDAVGIEKIKVTAKDKENAEVVAIFEIEVINVNDTPIVKTAMVDLTVNEDTPLSYDIKPHFEEIDLGDSLTYDVTFADGVLLPKWMDFIDGVLTVNASNEHVGEHLMKVTATDTYQAKTIEEFKITVVNVNDVPVGSNDVANTIKNTAVEIDVLKNDVDVDKDDTLKIKADSVSTPLNGTAEILNGKITYTPNTDYLGADSFTYIASDISGSETSTITVNVSVSNELLTITNAIGNKLVNNNETYIFRENDIVLADTQTDEFTEFLSYDKTQADGKIKVQFRNGEYDLISRTANGFIIEFFEFDNGVLKSMGAEETTNDLVEFTQNDLAEAFGDIQEEEIYTFNTVWKEKRHSSDYLVSGNKAIKVKDNDSLIIEAFNSLDTKSIAEARTYLNGEKTIVKSEVELVEANEYSKVQVMSVMTAINDSKENIYANINIKSGKISYYVGRYNELGDTELEVYSPTNSLIADVDTTISLNGEFKYRTKVEIEGTLIKFNVAKVNGSTGTIIEEYAEKTVDVNDSTLDLGFDKVQYRASSEITDTLSETPLEITKLIVHHHDARAGEVLSTPVLDAIAKIESIDIETENIDTKLAEVNALLENETSPDAMLAKAMLSIAEIANNPEIAGLLTIDVPEGMSTTSYLNKYIRSSVLDTINIKDNIADDSLFNLSSTATTTFHDTAMKLKKISDDLAVLFDDPKKVYEYDSSSMNYNQSLAFRATLLAVAFKLENLSAYQFGTNADFKTRIYTENSNEFEYNNIAIDPASVLNSGEFFKLVNASRVDVAKELIIEALSTALKLPVGFEDNLTQEDIDDAKKIKDALDGTVSSYLIEMTDDVEIKSINVDIATLFSSAGALDISDLGSSWENKCDDQYTLVSENIAKMENDLLCEYNNASYINRHSSSPKQTVLPSKENSGIDDVILSITKADTQNTVLTGQSVLDFVFEKEEQNNTPILKTEISDINVIVGKEKSYDAKLHFEDDDTLSYDVTFANGTLLPSWMDFNPTSAVLVINATSSEVGTHLMKITATDTDNQKVIEEFKVIVSSNSSTTPTIPTLDSDVVLSLNKLESIDPEIENIDTKLAEAKALIESNTSAEAKIVSLSIAIAEILNDSDVAPLLKFSDTSLDSTSTLNKIVRAMALNTYSTDIINNPTDLSLTVTNKLNTIADELRKISDEFGNLFTSIDDGYAYGTDNMNYNDSLVLRAGILSFSAQLKNLSSYQWGTDADLAIQSEDIGGTIYEYSNIDVNPAKLLNDGNFFKLNTSASSKLAEAKQNLIDAANLLLQLPLEYNKDAQNEGFTQEDINDITAVKLSLAGTNPYIINVNNDDKIKEVQIDLSKMFDVSTAIDISSFGSNWQNLCHGGEINSIEDAKKNGRLECKVHDWYDSFNDVDYYHYEGVAVKPQTLPTSTSSKIDDIVLNITKLDGSKLIGSEMIDFMLKDEAEIQALGTSWKNVKSDTNYLVNGNDVQVNDEFGHLLIDAYKAKITNSRAEAKKTFSTAKSEVKAKMRLKAVDLASDSTDGPVGRGSMIAIMSDINNSNDNIFIKVEFRPLDIKYRIYKYDSDFSSSSEISLNSGTIATTQTVYEDGLEAKFGVSIKTEGSDIKFNIAKLNGETGEVTESFTEKVYTADSSYDLGIDEVRFRAEVNLTGNKETLYDNVTTPTKLRVHGFEAITAEVTAPATTATLSNGDKAVLSGKNDPWFDIMTVGNGTISFDIYDNDNGTYSFSETETITVDLVNNSSSFNITQSGQEASIEISNTVKLASYTDLFRSDIKFTNTADISEEDTWDWTGHGAFDLDSLVTLFTNGTTYFQDANTTFMLKSDNTVVIGTFTGEDQYGRHYSASSNVVGSWLKDTTNNKIAVDLSTNYKTINSFSLDTNNNIVNTQTHQVGYVDLDFIYTGSDALKFFQDETGITLP